MKKLITLLICLGILLMVSLYVSIAGEAVVEPPPKQRLCLITGCARSGTTFITEFLKENGYVARHERDAQRSVTDLVLYAFGLDTPAQRNKDHMIASWPMAADSDTTPWGPGANEFRFAHTFHQVRAPLKTIASAGEEPEKSWTYIRTYVPEIKDGDSNIVKGAKYWYYWNLLAEKKSEWTYRIEDIEVELDEMSRRLSIPLDKEALSRVPRNTNTRGYAVVYTWEDLKKGIDPDLYEKIIQMAVRYGYPVPNRS